MRAIGGPAALLGAWAVGLLCGWLLRGRRGPSASPGFAALGGLPGIGGRGQERRTNVEEMRGWMPVTDMKIS